MRDALGFAISREELNLVRVTAPEFYEAEHFYVCAGCGQAVDMRRLGDVFHHDEPGHERLPLH